MSDQIASYQMPQVLKGMFCVINCY